MSKATLFGFRECAAAALLAAGLAGCAAEAKIGDAQGSIVRKDPRFDKIVPADAKLEVIAIGHVWTEGPVWNKEGKFLLFSDIPRNSIYRWKEGQGETLFLKPSGYAGTEPTRVVEPGSNGLTFDPSGRLTYCDHGNRRVVRLEADGKKTALAEKYDGKRLNSPNDLCFKSNGDLYFTDPPYGLMKHVAAADGKPAGISDPMKEPEKELPFQGVYRLGKDGTLTLLNKDVTRPNGIAFSPDEKTLYIASSDPDKAIWMAFPVKDDGTLGEGKVFYDSTPAVKAGKPGLPDGMKVDTAGNIFATGPGGLYVFAPDGTVLGMFDTGEPTSNCAWGDDGSTLYVTCNHNLCRIKLTTKGKMP